MGGPGEEGGKGKGLYAFFFTDVIGVQGEYNGSRDVIFEMAMNVPIAD